MWRTHDGIDLHDCPDAIANVPVGVQEEHAVLHRHIIDVTRFQIDYESSENGRPKDEHHELGHVSFRVDGARLTDVTFMQDSDTESQVDENRRLIGQCELSVVHQVLMSMRSTYIDEVSPSHRWCWISLPLTTGSLRLWIIIVNSRRGLIVLILNCRVS